MTRIIHVLAVLGLGSAWAIGDSLEARIKGAVSRNIDGDTVWVCPEGRGDCDGILQMPVKIRMVGMDAPEYHYPTSLGYVGQGKWGKLAHERFREMAPVGQKVEVEEVGRDSYGRMLARVYVGEFNTNLEMIRLGWAVPYFICEGPCNQDYFMREKVKAYVDACNGAKKEGLGIFDPSEPLSEMPFEFRLRMQNRILEKPVGDFGTKLLYEAAAYKKVDPCYRVFFRSVKDALDVGYRIASQGAG